jgi:hypothetical protein
MIITTAIWQMPWTVTMSQKTEPVWAWCKWCMERRDHEFVKGRGWFCAFCGEKNEHIHYDPRPTPRKALTDIAEAYLEENPEE